MTNFILGLLCVVLFFPVILPIIIIKFSFDAIYEIGEDLNIWLRDL